MFSAEQMSGISAQQIICCAQGKVGIPDLYGIYVLSEPTPIMLSSAGLKISQVDVPLSCTMLYIAIKAKHMQT